MERFNAQLRAAAEEALGPDVRIVTGEGPVRPRIMLIGEAPGEQEALQGRPFVGKAGKILDGLLKSVGLKREEIYISNAVKLRPTRLSPAGHIVNRPPSTDEVRFFAPWLMREIDLVAPELLVTLGNVPLRVLLGRQATIGEKHGSISEVGGRRLFPLYHPASLIYTPALRPVYEADVRALAETVSNI